MKKYEQNALTILGSELSSFVTGEIIKAGGRLGIVVSQESTFLSSSDNQSVNK
ncbi:hypothetical protein ACDX78_18905 [Virgibacillus oceani]